MISKKLSLILLALVFVIEAGALFWIRGGLPVHHAGWGGVRSSGGH